MDEKSLFTDFWSQGIEDDQQSAVADSRGLRLSARSEIPHRA